MVVTMMIMWRRMGCWWLNNRLGAITKCILRSPRVEGSGGIHGWSTFMRQPNCQNLKTIVPLWCCGRWRAGGCYPLWERGDNSVPNSNISTVDEVFLVSASETFTTKPIGSHTLPCKETKEDFLRPETYSSAQLQRLAFRVTEVE